MQTVLVIGANGFVGGWLSRLALVHGWHPVLADCGKECALPHMEYISLDITDDTNVKAAIRQVAPHLIVNLAAVADVDLAERERSLAYEINVSGAEHVASAARACGAHTVWFSSDAVYAGTAQCYSEEDVPAPINYYGETKRMGESAVLNADSTATVLRLSLVLGFAVKSGNSFVQGLYGKLLAGQSVCCPVREVRTPVDVITLCETVLELGERRISGIYNIGCQSSVDRYTLSCMLARAMGFSAELLQRQDQPDVSRAPRHRNGVLNITKLASILKTTRLKSLNETVAAATATKLN